MTTTAEHRVYGKNMLVKKFFLSFTSGLVIP